MIKKKLTVLKINNFFSKNKISISEIQKFIKEKKFLLKKKKIIKRFMIKIFTHYQELSW
mgnify:FL=1